MKISALEISALKQKNWPFSKPLVSFKCILRDLHFDDEERGIGGDRENREIVKNCDHLAKAVVG